jgi:hypothetical protein
MLKGHLLESLARKKLVTTAQYSSCLGPNTSSNLVLRAIVSTRNLCIEEVRQGEVVQIDRLGRNREARLGSLGKGEGRVGKIDKVSCRQTGQSQDRAGAGAGAEVSLVTAFDLALFRALLALDLLEVGLGLGLIP